MVQMLSTFLVTDSSVVSYFWLVCCLYDDSINKKEYDRATLNQQPQQLRPESHSDNSAGQLSRLWRRSLFFSCAPNESKSRPRQILLATRIEEESWWRTFRSTWIIRLWPTSGLMHLKLFDRMVKQVKRSDCLTGLKTQSKHRQLFFFLLATQSKSRNKNGQLVVLGSIETGPNRRTEWIPSRLLCRARLLTAQYGQWFDGYITLDSHSMLLANRWQCGYLKQKKRKLNWICLVTAREPSSFNHARLLLSRSFLVHHLVSCHLLQ